jgi:hypothetical protein
MWLLTKRTNFRLNMSWREKDIDAIRHFLEHNVDWMGANVVKWWRVAKCQKKKLANISWNQSYDLSTYNASIVDGYSIFKYLRNAMYLFLAL